jgi:antitoxin MazE
MKTVVQQWGNSLAVRIPRALARETRFARGTGVELSAAADGIIVKRSQKPQKLRLHQLLSKINAKTLHSEVKTGVRRGREIW